MKALPLLLDGEFMSGIDSAYMPRLVERIVHRERDGLHLLLHPRRPRWAAANRTGWEIARLCSGTETVRTIAGRVAERYGVDTDRVERDAISFLKSLDRSELLAGGTADREEPAPAVHIGSVFLHLTARCNLRCIHCYAGSGPQEREELSDGRIRSIIDELAGRGGRAITFSGGEPLLRSNWREILEYAADRLTVTLNTNGTLVRSAEAAFLARLDPYIQVSLDGPDGSVHDPIRGNGSFDATVRGIRALQDAGLGGRIIVSMTLMKRNIRAAPAMLDFVQLLGIPKLRFLPLHSQGRARSSWDTLDASVDEYLDWYRYVYYDWKSQDAGFELAGGLPGYLLYASSSEDEPWCGIGRRIVIDADGSVQPCSLLMDRSFSLGNVNGMSLAEIESSKRLGELTEACLSRKDRIPACRECTWRNFCQASCPAFAHLERGTLMATDDYCDFRRRLFEDSIFRIARDRQTAASG